MNFKDLLPNGLPFFKKSTPSEAIFALEINPDKVAAALWLVQGTQLQVLNTAYTKYESQADLVEAATRVLDQALADLPYDPAKILFGVPDFWLQDDNLKPEYLETLQKLTKDLDLSPLAYVSASHAISHFLQKQTGVPLTAVLVNYTEPLIVSVIKTGKIAGSREVKRGDDLAKDIEKGLMLFDEVEVLPSRILVFGQESMTGIKEKLTAYPWMAKLPFLHLPKIDLLDQSLAIQSICFAGASEIEPNVVYHPATKNSAAVANAHTKHLPIDESVNGKNKNNQMAAAGFVAGDITAQEEVDNIANVEGTELPSDEFDSEFESHQVAVREHHQPPAKNQHGLPAKAAFGGMNFSVVGIMAALSNWKNWLKSGWLVVLIPVVILVGLVFGYMSMIKSEVSVFVDAKTLDRQAQVIADPAVSAIDEAGLKIPGQIIQTTISDTAKGNATGKKQIGDPAKGKVIIYNKTDSPKSFSQGTVLTSSGGLKFVLDTAVQIASKSSTPGPGFSEVIKPGQSEAVGITASAIGPESNIPSATNLNLANFNSDQVIASVDTALTGGTSKDISIVTADDQKRLLAQLTSDLRKKAKDELQAKLTGDQRVLEDGLIEEVVRTDYSKKVNDQASEFSLTATVGYKGTAFSDADLRKMINQSVSTEVPDNYDLNLADAETQSAVSKIESDGRLIFTAKFKAKLVPKVNQEDIKKQIAGKSEDEADQILRSKIENVIGTDIVITPNVTPSFMKRLPWMTKNINVSVTAK